MKLGLGTVQLGMDYGVANSAGRPGSLEAKEILEVAVSSGVVYFDTAPAYGESEEILGNCLPDDVGLRVITKTSARGAGIVDVFEASLQRLRRDEVYGLLVHAADDLLGPAGEEVYGALQELKQQGRVAKIGVSVYDQAQLEGIGERFPLDIVQLPVNVLDQRLLRGGNLSALRLRGIEIHARSVFLQGLLLMDSAALPPYFDSVRDHLKRYRAYIGARGWSPLEAALGFLKQQEEIDVIVCGAETSEQLRQIHASYRSASVDASLLDFAVDDPRILDPSRWTVAGP